MKSVFSIICSSLFLFSCQKEQFTVSQEEQSHKITNQYTNAYREAGGSDNGTWSSTICYVSLTNPAQVNGATQKWIINWDGTITIRTTFPKTFADNTYGTTAVGWTRGHTFRDLVGSDNLQLALYDRDNIKRMEFKIDYITASTTVPSGYKTLGVTGGEGQMILGNASDVVEVRTSIDENLNRHNYVLTTNSPVADNNYSQNADYPNWIYDIWYEVTVKPTAFGAAGFGIPSIASIHASPSKTGNNTEVVVPGDCIGEEEGGGGTGGEIGGGNPEFKSIESAIVTDFNKSPIVTGSNIWFNANLKVSGKISANTIIKIENGSISAPGSSTPLQIPPSVITFSNTAAPPVYDEVNNVWKITAALSQRDEMYFGGLIYVSPGLPGEMKKVNMKNTFSSNTTGIKIEWKWSAAVYNANMNYGDLDVVGVEENKIKPGTPLGYKAFSIDGGKGNAGNYTGSWSKSESITIK